MTSGATRKATSGTGPAAWISFALSLLNVACFQWWPGTLAATLASRAFIAYMTIWLVLRIRKGYLLRRPYWTRESWLRYLRLAWMPVAALAVFFTVVLLHDYRVTTFGSPQSAARITFIVLTLALMLFGAAGLIRLLEWMERGEPSQQFTRTRWFQRGRPIVPG